MTPATMYITMLYVSYVYVMGKESRHARALV